MINMSVLSNIFSPPALTHRVRFPIRFKITIPYLILSVILAVAAAYLTTQVVVENLEERFNKQLFEAGRISSELLVSYESRLLETQRLLANVAGVSEAIVANDPNTLRSLTLGIVANDRQEAVEFFDVRGDPVLSMHHRLGGNPEEYDILTGSQSMFSSQDVVQTVINEDWDAQGNKFAGLIKTDSGVFLYVSGPVHDLQGKLTGVVLVGRALSTMAADLRVKTFAQISLYDPSGQMVYSTLPFPQNLTQETVSQILSFKDTSSAVRDLEVTNILFTEILGAWEVRGNQELGVLGVAISQNPIVQASASSRWRIFLLVASANFLIILVGINLANIITRPLIQLVWASVEVSKGDLDVQIPTRTNDEISVLTESFNNMVTSLNQSQKELIRAYDNTLEGWGKALELRDHETEGHSVRVTLLTVQVAEAMGIRDEALVNIRRGALLHDIGKMGIPDSILHKNGGLDSAEMAIVRKHPGFAYDMLKGIDYLQRALEIPYCHHEKWDGTGYPDGLKGEEIPISARIFAIVDVWDALTSDRPYRKAVHREEVIPYLKDQSGKHFDPAVVDVFMQILQLPQ
jgi:putative nucleotidyltransferase with HDIG domain